MVIRFSKADGTSPSMTSETIILNYFQIIDGKIVLRNHGENVDGLLEV